MFLPPFQEFIYLGGNLSDCDGSADCIAQPRTAPIATTPASRVCKSEKAPRTADPAFIRSSTIATRLPLTAVCSAFGTRYSTGYNPSRVVSAKRSAYAKSQPSLRGTIKATKATSTSGPHTTSTLYCTRCAAGRTATYREWRAQRDIPRAFAQDRRRV
jgi:hypothetical protein